MNDLRIFLTTRDRPQDQLTLLHMPTQWVQRTTVVCPREDRRDINEYCCGTVADFAHPKVDNLAQKREWIFRYCAKQGIEKILMLDDDLEFRCRYPHSTRVYKPEATDLRLHRMFKKLEEMLDHYAHGGVAMQFMQQSNTEEWKYGGRYLHLLAYHVPTVMENCKLGRVTLSSDYDYALQLMEAGYTSAVYCRATESDPNGFNAPGGVSRYRNAKLIRQQAELLAKLHPGIVKLMPYKAGSKYEHLGVRTQASWKKALAMGLEYRDVLHGTLDGKAARL